MGSIGKALYNLGFLVRETGQALDRLGCRLQGKYGYVEELNRHRTLMNLFDKQPKVPATAFVAPSAAVIGDVTIGPNTSIWYGAVVRGDVNSISIGKDTNIQDGSIVHVAKTSISGKILPTIIGDRVTIGHNATIHACTIEDEALIGIGATVLDGAVVQKGAMVAAGALVPQDKTIPSGQLWAGVPAKFMRDLTEAEKEFLPRSAANYVKLAEVHAEENAKTFEEIIEDKELRTSWAEYDEDLDSSAGISREPPPIPKPVAL